MPEQQAPLILFTAFEPSGDDLGAAVIRALLLRPAPEGRQVRIAAWGGPKMRAAGAQIIEETGHDAAMGLPGAKKIAEHVAMNKRIAAWVRANKPAMHVPVDSPAANFPVCKVTKAGGAKVVHLAAPQVWAWARHRVNKLRRLTDLVLCLLPFEEPWFKAHAVPARFIGHPLFDQPTDDPASQGEPAHAQPPTEARSSAVPPHDAGPPRLALLPGSRPAEWKNNFPAMLEAFARVRARWPDAAGVVVASSERAESALRRIAAEHAASGSADSHAAWPAGLTMLPRAVDDAAAWCDAALTVSGTVTLHLAKRAAPMVVIYRIPAWKHWLIGRWIVRSQFATLPNLIAGRKVIEEFVPYAGSPTRIIAALERLLSDGDARETQRAGLREVTAKFAGKNAAEEAAEAITALLGA